MKQLCMTLGFVATVAFMWNIVPCNQEVFARDGCCKKRKSEKDKWVAIGKSYEDCKKLNKTTDNDRIFKASGLFWWDRNC